MKGDTLSDLLRVRLSEDSVQEYDPKPAVGHFLTSGCGTRHTAGHSIPNASHVIVNMVEISEVEPEEIRLE